MTVGLFINDRQLQFLGEQELLLEEATEINIFYQNNYYLFI